MLLRQLFNHPTFSYTYLLADPMRSEAVLIDPVRGKLRDYVQLTNELGLTITAAIDTHHHDDRSSGVAALRQLWNCEAIAGASSPTEGISRHVMHDEIIDVGGMRLTAIHTPGHSQDSYSFLIEQPGKSAVFTGDTLLVRTVGLSNQDTSDPRSHYNSLVNVLLQLPEDTIVYPGRDFKGWPLSTIGEEKSFNPYLQAANIDEFLELKSKQVAAHIQPLMKVVEEEEEDIEITEAEGFATPPSADFYLPSSDAETGNSVEFEREGNPDDDDPGVPSWR